MKFTYYGHGCIGIEFNGKNLLVDPFITPNELAKDININDIPADYILITHGHEDHVADAAAIANNTGAKIISNFEIVSWFGQQGIQGHPMNHGGKWEFDFGFVKYVSAIHSSVLPDGTYGGNPGGFVIWNDNNSIYIAGDTALTMDMKLIPMLCPKLDIAIMPMGDNFTMGLEEALLASDFVECNNVLGCHYDTFGFIKIDHDKYKAAFATQDKTLHLPRIGETITV